MIRICIIDHDFTSCGCLRRCVEEARAHTQARYRKRRRGVWRRIEKGNAERDQGRPAGVGGQARGLTLSLIAAFVCGLLASAVGMIDSYSIRKKRNGTVLNRKKILLGSEAPPPRSLDDVIQRLWRGGPP